MPCLGVETLAGGVVLALCCERLSSETGLKPESFVPVLTKTGASSSELSLSGGSSVARSGSGSVSLLSAGRVGFVIGCSCGATKFQ